VILLQIIDSRYPLFHFSIGFHHYVTQELKKPMIIVLTKADLNYKDAIEGWKKYFKERFNITAIPVSSFTQFDDDISDGNVLQLRKLQPKPRSDEILYKSSSGMETLHKVLEDTMNSLDKLIKPNQITIGTVGDPNAGKSSLINALKGKHVVSVSKTPGHTKHFQTIVLQPGIVLCDCPGMVFPAVDRSRYLQVLTGLYPISHLREPFAALRYAAERIPIEKIFDLEDSREYPEEPWSPFSMGAAYAVKHQQFIEHFGSPDAQRGARNILSFIIDGRVRLCWGPPKNSK